MGYESDGKGAPISRAADENHWEAAAYLAIYFTVVQTHMSPSQIEVHNQHTQ